MFIANHDRVALRHSRGDHRVAMQQLCHLERQFGVALLALTDPGGGVGRDAKADVIGGGYVCDDAIDGADFDAVAALLRALRENRASGVRMSQDERSAGTVSAREFARIVRALM